MKELYAVYEEALKKLQERHDRLIRQIFIYDKRVTLLEEEIDEMHEAMCMMRRYLTEG